MKLLVLGGTRFVGRHIVEAALEAGHQVELFNRGKTGAGLFPDLKTWVGDRDGDHSVLKSGSWDAVIDATAYRPAHAVSAARALKGRCGRYLFVSTVSVYEDFAGGGDEDARIHRPAPADAASSPETYGPLKAAAEAALAFEWGRPLLIARPGLVAGPHDHTGRFTYWPVRFSRGGRVLMPGPSKPLQYVDVRDLGSWLVASASSGLTGVFNAVGPATTFGALAAACGGGDVAWADDRFLRAQGVAPWSELPLWIPGDVKPFDGGKAAAAGLRSRPLAETAADCLADWRAKGSPEPASGLAPERERRLLEALG